MASVIRVFPVPSSNAQISVVEHPHRWELIIRNKTGQVLRRSLDPRVAKALIQSLRVQFEELATSDVRPNATDP